MADSGASSDPLQRYGAIEKAYTEDRWGAVIEKGELLLNDLPWIAGGNQTGLKERVQLLMAHAHLYGFGQREPAQRLYQEVISAGGEETLLQIARQGLEQCASMPASPAAVEASSIETSAVDAAASQEPAPAEQVPLVLGGGGIAEPVAQSTGTEFDTLITAPAAQPEGSGAATPAMPWLSTTEQAALQTQATAAVAQPSATEERLIPEVIEEPEQIEVHQADPLRAEELVVPVRESLAAAASAEEISPARVSVLPSETPTETPAVTAISAEAAALATTAEEPVAFETLKEEELTPSPARGLGVFRNPPKPVARENPELLLGLLRVQMG